MNTVNKGFTLVETIIGIVVLSIVCGGIISLLISQKSAFKDPIIQEKTTQLAKRVIREIKIRAFDEKSDIGGGFFRCGETIDGITIAVDCSNENEYGPDLGESNLDSLDDVDDFRTMSTNGLGKTLCDASLGFSCIDNYIPASYFYSYGEGSEEYYRGYLVKVEVEPMSISVGESTNIAKRITIRIRNPDNDVTYSFVKTNI